MTRQLQERTATKTTVTSQPPSNRLLRVSATELQNNFGKYLQLAHEGTTITITKNNTATAKLTPVEFDWSPSPATQRTRALAAKIAEKSRGMSDIDYKKELGDYLAEKYGYGEQ